jgi:hypothetical protein
MRKYYLSKPEGTWLIRESDVLARQDLAAVTLYNFSEVIPASKLFGIQMRTGKSLFVRVPPAMLKRLGLPPVSEDTFEVLLETKLGIVSSRLRYCAKVHKPKGD